ncbi:MAG: hypothetical protein L0287_32575 [Anaerolineae bacterium]|nr:hypothetical protein [Anaerolineae bacterium]
MALPHPASPKGRGDSEATGQKASQFCRDVYHKMEHTTGKYIYKTVEGHHTKTDIVVPIIRVVVVADRNTRVVFIVVPRAATQTL